MDPEKRRRIIEAFKRNYRNLVADFERLLADEADAPEAPEEEVPAIPPPPEDRKRKLRRAMKINAVMSRHPIWDKRFK